MTPFSIGDIVAVTVSNIAIKHFANDGTFIQDLDRLVPLNGFRYWDGVFDSAGALFCICHDNDDDGHPFGQTTKYSKGATSYPGWLSTDAGLADGHNPIWGSDFLSPPLGDNAFSIGILPDGTLMVAGSAQSLGSSDSHIYLVDRNSGALIETLTVAAADAGGNRVHVGASFDNDTIYYSDQKSIRAYRRSDSTQLTDLTGNIEAITVKPTIDGNLAISRFAGGGDNPGTIEIYDTTGSILASTDMNNYYDMDSYGIDGSGGSIAPDPFDPEVVWINIPYQLGADPEDPATQAKIAAINVFTETLVHDVSPEGIFGAGGISGLAAMYAGQEVHPAVHRLSVDGSSVWRTRTT